MQLSRSIVIMWTVAAATLPALIAHAVVYGSGVWTQLAIALLAATASEAACLRWQHKPLSAAADGSAVVAACILAVALPPAAPWFVIASATVAAIALAKHCYGGLGNNPFNPAMVGYALTFMAFPQYFTDWSDAISSPTPLAAAKLGIAANGDNATVLLAAAAAAGGGILLVLRFADWRLTLAFLLGAAAVHATAGEAWHNLLAGGLIFTAFFVITDPVTAANSRRGRWLYGFLVGALALWLRRHGAHSDGIAFAVLIGNMLAPLCDRLTAWRR